MVVVVVKYVLGCHIHVGYWEYASRIQIGDCWFLCILCVRDVVLLKNCQFDQHRIFLMFCIVTRKFHWLLVYCWKIGGKGISDLCYFIWMRFTNSYFLIGWWLYVWKSYDKCYPFFLCCLCGGVGCLLCFNNLVFKLCYQLYGKAQTITGLHFIQKNPSREPDNPLISK